MSIGTINGDFLVQDSEANKASAALAWSFLGAAGNAKNQWRMVGQGQGQTDRAVEV